MERSALIAYILGCYYRHEAISAVGQALCLAAIQACYDDGVA